MICPDETRSTLNAEPSPGTVWDLRQLSQAEAQVLGSVNYCVLPTPTLEPVQEAATGAAQRDAAGRLTRSKR